MIVENQKTERDKESLSGRTADNVELWNFIYESHSLVGDIQRVEDLTKIGIYFVNFRDSLFRLIAFELQTRAAACGCAGNRS